MTTDTLNKIGLLIVLATNLVTFLKNAYTLKKMIEGQREFKRETRGRLDELEKTEY